MIRLGLLLLISLGSAHADTPIVVGSKNFTESYVLAEIMAQSLERAGYTIERRFGLGGTKICYEALIAGEIDLYPEYTGTIAEAILDNPRDIAHELQAHGLEMGRPFGFNNTYAIAVSQSLATERKLATISDLRRHPDLRISVSHEFLNRPDGWPGLRNAYELPAEPTGIEHGLAYPAIANGQIDVTDAYSTDGELDSFALTLLTDDKAYFPEYLAVPLIRATLAPEARTALSALSNQFDETAMRRLNARVVIDRESIEAVARDALGADGVTNRSTGDRGDRWAERLTRNTLRHLQLTSIALAAAAIVGLLLATAIYSRPTLAATALNVTAILQTIPSIALLALMIPLLGIGFVPAVVALFLYSLLPILRNAVTALTTIEPVYVEVADALGLTAAQKLRRVLLPLATPHILAGIRTAAVISIGTATLAAFIGAGGLGEPIVTGLALNDTRLILEGAIPAALLAIATEFSFAAVERAVVPAHLRSTAT